VLDDSLSREDILFLYSSLLAERTRRSRSEIRGRVDTRGRLRNSKTESWDEWACIGVRVRVRARTCARTPVRVQVDANSAPCAGDSYASRNARPLRCSRRVHACASVCTRVRASRVRKTTLFGISILSPSRSRPPIGVHVHVRCSM